MLQAFKNAAAKIIRTPNSKEDVSEAMSVEPLEVGRLNKSLGLDRLTIVDHAWRCIWDEVEGSQVSTGGTTYAASRTFLLDFVKVFEGAIDPLRPALHNKPVRIEMVKVERQLFTEIMTNTSGIVHVNSGLHKHDFQCM